MKPLSIAVTGGRGRLAPHVADYFRASDSEVVCFSRSAGDGFEPIALLTKPRTLAKFDAILHLGWSTVPFTSEQRAGSEQTTDLHCFTTFWTFVPSRVSLRILSFFPRRPFTETQSFLLPKRRRAARWADMPTANCWLKKSSEPACAAQDSLRCSILRISNVFGTTTRSSTPQGIISRVCRAIREETLMSIWGDGSNTKDYLFQVDLLDAVQAIVARALTGTFNVASEQSLSVNEIVSLVEMLTGKTLRVAHFPAFSWDVARSYISVRKLRVATGWRARYDPKEAVRQMTEAEIGCVS